MHGILTQNFLSLPFNHLKDQIMSNYLGHLNDGSSVQKHSAGGIYPCVLFSQETPTGRKYGLITPDNQSGKLYESYDIAVNAAIQWNDDEKLYKALQS